MRPPLRQRLAAWRSGHRRAAWNSLSRLLGRPFGSTLTVAVLALAIALPLCLLVLVGEVERVSRPLRDSRELAVFLPPSGEQTAAASFAARWQADPRLQAVELRSPDDGLAELRSMRDLGEALAALEHNPLPWVVLLMPRPGVDDHALAAELRGLEGVDYVQHDAAWRDRLNAWLALSRRLVAVLGGLLGVTLLLVVGNTVRLDVRAQAEEIGVLRLLGAEDGFIRRPFLYLGAWYGVAAGLLAGLLVAAVLGALAPAMGSLVDSYGGPWSPPRLSLGSWALALLAAVLLGVLGARLAVGHHLRQAEVA